MSRTWLPVRAVVAVRSETATHESTEPSHLVGLARSSRVDSEQIIAGAGVLALATVAVGTGLRILGNLPFEPVALPAVIETGVRAGTPLVVALATVAVALGTDGSTRVGLLFVGVFGLLAALVSGASVAAMVGVTLGGWVALGGRVVPGGGMAPGGWGGRPLGDPRSVTVAALFAGGVTASLSSAVGMGPRGFGTLLTLAGIAALPALVDRDWRDVTVGALAVVAVLGAAVTSPYVAGATLLVGFAITGVPLLVVALAVGGCATTVSAGVRAREAVRVAGAALCLLAGVPVTVPRATALLLGATLLLAGPREVSA